MPRQRTKKSVKCPEPAGEGHGPCTYCRGHSADHRDADARTWPRRRGRGNRAPNPEAAARASMVASLWQQRPQMSQADIARETGVSRQRVRQILDRAGLGGDRELLAKLREQAATAGVSPDDLIELAGAAAQYREDIASGSDVLA